LYQGRNTSFTTPRAAFSSKLAAQRATGELIRYSRNASAPYLSSDDRGVRVVLEALAHLLASLMHFEAVAHAGSEGRLVQRCREDLLNTAVSSLFSARSCLVKV
jgi:hypothetical protein